MPYIRRIRETVNRKVNCGLTPAVADVDELAPEARFNVFPVLSGECRAALHRVIGVNVDVAPNEIIIRASEIAGLGKPDCRYSVSNLFRCNNLWINTST